MLIALTVTEQHGAGVAHRCGHFGATAVALGASTGLPAGDALHLACAEQSGAKSIATLNAALGGNAQRLKTKSVVFS